MTLADLPEIDFIDADVMAERQALITLCEGYLGRALAAGDPLIPFLNALAYKHVQLEVKVNQIAKGQYLRYANKGMLDNMGALTNTNRLSASAARVTIRFNFSLPLAAAQTIPAGTRIGTADGDGTVYFATTQAIVAPIGSIQVDTNAVCNVAGAIGNSYAAGQLDTLIDPLPYVQSISNLTAPSGGADIESDDAYRERIHIRPESFSVAGPSGAYEYWAKTANPAIVDVSVDSPAPVQVLITVLLSGGVIPGASVLQQVSDVLNTSSVRPLTDKVTVQAPTASTYNMNYTYYINRSQETDAEAIKAAVAAATTEYALWQKSRLGRDINPSQLIAKVMAAGASRVTVTAPAYTVLSKSQVAQDATATATFGGFEDG